MPRTALTPTALGPNSQVVRPAGTTIDATLVTNGVVIKGVPLEELVIEVDQTAVGGKAITINAGDAPPALEARQGNLQVTVAQNATGVFGPFTSGRFSQADRSIEIDFASGTTGAIRAYHVTRKA